MLNIVFGISGLLLLNHIFLYIRYFIVRPGWAIGNYILWIFINICLYIFGIHENLDSFYPFDGFNKNNYDGSELFIYCTSPALIVIIKNLIKKDNVVANEANTLVPNYYKSPRINFLKIFKIMLLYIILPAAILGTIYFGSLSYIKNEKNKEEIKLNNSLKVSKALLPYPIDYLGIEFNDINTKYEDGRMFIKMKLNVVNPDHEFKNIIATKLRTNKYSFNLSLEDSNKYTIGSHTFSISDFTPEIDSNRRIVRFSVNNNFEFSKDIYKAFLNFEISTTGSGIDPDQINKEFEAEKFGKPIDDINYLGTLSFNPEIVKDSFYIEDGIAKYNKINFSDPENIGGNFNLRNLRPYEFISYKLVMTKDFTKKANFSLIALNFNADKIKDYCTILYNKLTDKCGFYLFLSESKTNFRIILLEEANYNQKLAEKLADVPNIKAGIQVNIFDEGKLIEFDSNNRESLKIPYNGIGFNEYEGSGVWVFYFNETDKSIRVLDTGQ